MTADLTQYWNIIRDVVLETAVLVSRALETDFPGLGLGLGLETRGLGLGLGLDICGLGLGLGLEGSVLNISQDRPCILPSICFLFFTN